MTAGEEAQDLARDQAQDEAGDEARHEAGDEAGDEARDEAGDEAGDEAQAEARDRVRGRALVARPPWYRDIWQLAKPGILSMCVFTAAGAMWLAPGTPTLAEFVWLLVGTALTVASANAYNMVWERELDQSMQRTKHRPVAAGRMRPSVALTIATVQGIAGVVLLWLYVNPLSAMLGLSAILSYVLVYTPMKTRSSAALFVGTIPGAMPPLLGWVGATGSVDVTGLVLFFILVFWQIPHFLAISIYRRLDYERAGIKVVPSVRGEESAKNQALGYSLALVATSLLLVPLQIAGYLYFVVASLLGAWFFIYSALGFERGSGNRWARKFFFASLVYLPVLIVGLAVDLAVG